MRQKTFTLSQGMVNDLDPAKSSSPQAYYDAVNMTLTEDNGFYALSNMGGTIDIALDSDADDSDHRWLGAWPVIAKFGINSAQGTFYEERDAIALISSDTNSFCNIYIYDKSGERLYRIYNDNDRPLRDRTSPLNVAEQIDGFSSRDGDSNYLYWVDGVNPVRYIPLVVNDESQYDNSVFGLSPLFIANEPDLLYLQRLYPCDPLTVSSVSEGGALLAGSYSFSYRYYNTETRKYSTWFVFSQPIPIVTSGTSETTNGRRVVGANTVTNKKITLSNSRQHFHASYYDSIQIAWIRYTDDSTPLSAFATSPSRDYYTGSASISITGSETGEEIQLADVVVKDSEVYTATTIEEENGRLFLGNLQYQDLSVDDTDITNAFTIKEALPVSCDPMIDQSVSGRGYYDPINTYRRKGYFRGEVERFARSYVDKFGRWSAPSPFDFSDPSLGYDPNSHVTTWQKNWATAGSDWKFLDRESSEGSLFNQEGTAIHPIGLRITGVGNHPFWAYGISILRAKRIKNIIGQTPIINGVAIQGSSYNLLFDEGENENATPWTSGKGGFDYIGDADTYVPKVLSMGAAKSLLQERANISPSDPDFSNTNDTFLYYGVWKLNNTYLGPVANNRPEINLYYLFPLEYLANNGSRSYGGFEIPDGCSLDIIDAVALQCFNAYRNEKATDTRSPLTANYYTDGKMTRMAFVFSTQQPFSYYYHNSNNPVGGLLEFKAIPVAGDRMVPCAPDQEIPIAWRRYLEDSHAKFVSGKTFSSDFRISNIQSVDGLEELNDEMNDQGTLSPYDENILTVRDFGGPYPTRNPRCIIVSLEIPGSGNFNSAPKFVGDPTEYIYKTYIQPGLTAWGDMFHATLPGVNADAVHEDPVYQGSDNGGGEGSFDNTKYGASGTVTNEYNTNRMIDPAGSIVSFVANIVKGLPDDRYSDKTSLEYTHTGAYTMLLNSQVVQGTRLDFSIWGGNCFISRLIADVRQNAPRKKSLFLSKPGSQTAPIGFHNRVFSRENHVEVIDMWVESEVNGHDIFRDSDQYPSGVLSRPTGHLNPGTSLDFQYPRNGMQAYVSPRLYLANFGAFANNDAQFLFEVADEIDVVSRYGSNHIQTSTQIQRGTAYSWDSFLQNDIIVLESTSPISKIVRSTDNKLIIAQENTATTAYLGQSIVEDEASLQLRLSSGKVIGTLRQVHVSSEAGGEFGIYSPTHSAFGGKYLYCFDIKRQRIFTLSENGVVPIDSPRVQAFMRSISESDILNDRTRASVLYNPKERQVMFMARPRLGTQEGVAMLSDSGTIFSRLELPVTDVIHWGSSVDATQVLATNSGNTKKIWKIDQHPVSRSMILGQQGANYVEVILSSPGGEEVTPYNIHVRSYGQPSGLDITVMENGHEELYSITGLGFVKMRDQGIFACTNLYDADGKRARGRMIKFKIYCNSDDVIQISSIKTKYRVHN